MKEYRISDIENIVIHGRTGSGRDPLVLFWTGSGVELNLRAAEAYLEVETDYDIFEQWVSVEVNGTVISRQMLPKGRSRVGLFRGMDAEKVTNVRVYKEVQPMSTDDANMLLVHSLLTDGEIMPISERKTKIEFIGDSLTSGEGLNGAVGEIQWISQWFSSVKGYTRLVSKELCADYRVVSQSGWGVLSSWDNDPRNTLPRIYDHVCGVVSGERNMSFGAGEINDFAAWQPDIIFINLGANDIGAFNNPEWVGEDGQRFKQRKEPDGSYNKEDLARLTDAAESFLIKIRKYNPSAKICWIYGMLGYELFDCFDEAVSRCRAAGDDNVFAKKISPAKDEDIGSREHPGERANIIAANEVAAIARELLEAKP